MILSELSTSSYGLPPVSYTFPEPFFRLDPFRNVAPLSGTLAPMTTTIPTRISAPSLPQIECGSCQQKLPLRLTTSSEQAAVWLCAKCNVPFVACCVEESLLKDASKIRLGERSFDVAGQQPISLSERQRVIKLASRPVNAANLEKRRSERVSQSLVVPAVKLGPGFVPIDEPFQILVANLSREGVGLIHNDAIDTEYIALEFSPTSESPIQVIVRLVRQRELTRPYCELGGVFLVRLGSVQTTE